MCIVSVLKKPHILLKRNCHDLEDKLWYVENLVTFELRVGVRDNTFSIANTCKPTSRHAIIFISSVFT